MMLKWGVIKNTEIKASEWTKANLKNFVLPFVVIHKSCYDKLNAYQALKLSFSICGYQQLL